MLIRIISAFGMILQLLLFVFSCNSQPLCTPNIKVEKVTELQNTFEGENWGGNSYFLQNMPDGYPIIGWSCAKSYTNCTVGFYDRNFNLIASYREPYLPGEKIMNIFSDDLDTDGEPEILMSVRMEKPGIACLNWNPGTKQLEEKWFFSMDAKEKGAYHRGSIAGNFTNHPGKEVCFGSSRGMLYLLTSAGKLITAAPLPRNNSLTVQRICTCDIDKDGCDEMIISTGRRPGMVTYCKWNPENLKLEIIWQADVTPEGMGGNNCYEAVFHSNGNPNGGPAIGAVTEEETNGDFKGSFLLLDMNGKILWQDVMTHNEGRAGACDFNDVTGDGVPEIIGRYAGGKDGTGILIYNNYGNRLGKFPGVLASSAGPPVFYLEKNGTTNTYIVATSTVYTVGVE